MIEFNGNMDVRALVQCGLPLNAAGVPDGTSAATQLNTWVLAGIMGAGIAGVSTIKAHCLPPSTACLPFLSRITAFVDKPAALSLARHYIHPLCAFVSEFLLVSSQR